MSPEDFDVDLCSYIVEPLGAGETRRVDCPVGGVKGHYLVIQLNSSSERLTICEVTAEGMYTYG